MPLAEGSAPPAFREPGEKVADSIEKIADHIQGTVHFLITPNCFGSLAGQGGTMKEKAVHGQGKPIVRCFL